MLLLLSLYSSNTNEFLRECQGAALLEADSSSRGRSRLNDRERRQAALPILVFGNDLVTRIFSTPHTYCINDNVIVVGGTILFTSISRSRRCLNTFT